MAKNLIKLGSSKANGNKKTETVEIFELDDKIYSVPAKVSAGVSLNYLRKQVEEGPDAAIYYIMTTLLGEEAFDALASHPDLSKGDLDKVMAAVEKHALSDEEGK